MIFLVISIIGSAFLSWLITRYYYIRSTKKEKELYEKLSSEVRNAILEDQRKKLTVEELNKILISKTVNKNHKGPLPYKACPKCGSENLFRGMEYYVIDSETAVPLKFVECIDCGWKMTEMEELNQI